jgi:Uma2 family endonuclease
MGITQKLMTAEELLRLPDDWQRHELIAGELRTMAPTGGEHGGIVMTLGASLYNYVRSHGLGHVLAGEPGFLLARNPDTVRAPDVAFISHARLGGADLAAGYQPGAPDLAAEVVSPNDRPASVAEKVATWLRYGARMVVVLDPGRRTVAVHRPDSEVRSLTEDDTLDGADVVPGWSVPVGDLFAPGG